MKTFKKSYLPESVTYKGQELKLNITATGAGDRRGSMELEANWQKVANHKTVCLIQVQSPKLKGKLDLHGKPYQPLTYIFSN